MTPKDGSIVPKGVEDRTPEATLPAILSSGRRWIFGRLLANGALQVVATISIALAVSVVDPSDYGLSILLVTLAVLSAAVISLRLVELVDAERLGQHYVGEVRLALFDGLADDSRRMRQGVAMTQLMNDLASLKTWVGLGLARSSVSVLSLAGCLAATALIDPTLALVVSVPIMAVGVASALLYRPLRRRVAEVRRRRGRLEVRLGRVLLSLEQLGQVRLFRRNRRRVEKAGEGIAVALERRVWVSAVLRAWPEATLPAILLLTVAVGLATQGPAGLGLVLLAGLAVDPLRNAARALEYCVAYQEAHLRIGATMTAAASVPLREPSRPTNNQCRAPDGTLAVLNGDRSANRCIWALREGVPSVDPDQPVLRASLRRNIDMARLYDEAPERLQQIAEICALTPAHGFAAGLDTHIDGRPSFLTREEAGRIRLARALASTASLIFVDDLSLVSHRLGASALIRAADLLNVTIVVNVGDDQWPTKSVTALRGQ